jgi:myo-inositol-1(or 4)-monophosphatase
MSNPTDHRLAIALEAVRDAGRLVQDIRHAGLSVRSKGPQDFVTQADTASERHLRETLRAAFPEDGFFGEEGGLSEGTRSGGVWVVDPVDGTTNFALGHDYWCISAAWVSGGVTELGIVHAPDRGETYVARRGAGTTLNGAALRLPDGAPEGGVVVVGLGRSNRRPRADYLAVIDRLLDGGVDYRRLGSGALHIAQVAKGAFAGYYEAHMNSWDAVAALLVVREAGGWTNDYLAGGSLSRGNVAVACATPLRDRLLPLLMPEPVARALP